MHTREHESWLEEWILGTPDAISADRARELERCEVCADARARMTSVRSALQRDARIEREDLEHARATISAPGLERVDSTLRAAIPVRGTAQARPSRSPRIARFALAAGLLALIAGVLWLRRGDDPRDVPLNTTRIELLRPIGREGFSLFEWHYPVPLPSGASFVVTVYTVPEDPSKPARELKRQTTVESSWRPDGSETAKWPQQIEWQVRAVADGKYVDTSQRRRAERSP
jgi:hypothetical protein